MKRAHPRRSDTDSAFAIRHAEPEQRTEEGPDGEAGKRTGEARRGVLVELGRAQRLKEIPDDLER